MYSFRNDYSEGAHPRILNAMLLNNLVQEDGYGMDSHTINAQKLIKEAIGSEEVDVHLLSGGTLSNLLAISSFLRPHEAVISTENGHIATFETGAIEATGHKVIVVPSHEGKLSSASIETVLTAHHFEHMVKPKLVYISNPTEFGTVYTKNELADLYETCQKHDLILYCDGARLGAALALDSYDIGLKEMYKYTDGFFIGGTKLGAYIGEALVIKNHDLKEEFRYLTKQRGALLAKGRLLGIQFEELFKDGLYYENARVGNKMATMISDELSKMNIKFLIPRQTNQVFPIFKNSTIEILSEKYQFYVWEKIDEEKSAIRLITSWATKEEAIIQFIEDCKNIIIK